MAYDRSGKNTCAAQEGMKLRSDTVAGDVRICVAYGDDICMIERRGCGWLPEVARRFLSFWRKANWPIFDVTSVIFFFLFLFYTYASICERFEENLQMRE